MFTNIISLLDIVSEDTLYAFVDDIINYKYNIEDKKIIKSSYH